MTNVSSCLVRGRDRLKGITVIKPLAVTAAIAAALTLTACGGGSDKSSAQKQAESQLSAINSAVSHAAAQASDAASDLSSDDLSSIMNAISSASSVPSSDASHIDVCALLSQADAQSVAMADKLDGAQTASTVYKLTTTDNTIPGTGQSACRFDISSGGAEGTVLFIVKPGSDIKFLTLDKKLEGLGDEAYTGAGGGTAVRVGGLMLDEGDDSFGDQMTIDLLRKMVPNLKP